ncbi:histidine kinase [Streptomyces noursei]|uniref:histidine kinase n=1 Tax=Streptomyces noursei TaxID=1971 RepID=UPI003BF5CFAB
MSRRERPGSGGSGAPRWIAYGRSALVLLLTFNSVHHGALAAGGRYLALCPAAGVLCGLVVLVRGLPWPTAPLVATAAVAWWGAPIMPLLLVALFDLAAQRRTWVAVGCSVTALGVNFVRSPEFSLWNPQQYGGTLFLLLAVVGGLWAGHRRRLVRALNAQVEHLWIERELREEAARAAERARIAAEMHDVLAHRLSLIALHSGVLTTRNDALPAQVGQRLALLRTASTPRAPRAPMLSPPGSGSSACASASRRSAANCTPGPSTAVPGGWPPAFPIRPATSRTAPAHDPRHDRR